jgi:hypothetical protein
MMSIRSSAGVALLVALLVAVLAAGCGGSTASSAPSDAGTGTGSGTDAAASAGAGSGTTGASAPAASVEPGGGTGSGGGAAEDAATVGEQLVPPNSTEQVKTTTDTYWYVTYESTDSPDTLKAFYESQIPKTALKIISTTSTGGAYVWTIARDDSGSFGGAVTVAPSGSGSGSSVIVAVGSS